MNEISTKLVIVGGGPGGYVAAIRASQLGVETVLIEEKALGGTCLNVGCIPSKALIHSASVYHEALLLSQQERFGVRAGKPNFDLSNALVWKDALVGRLTGGVAHLLTRAKTRTITGHAKLIDGKTVTVQTLDGVLKIRAEHFLIATGSKAQELPQLPFDEDIMSSTEALALKKIPKSLTVVGAGYIGLELGTAFAKLGSDVTIIETAKEILPSYDSELKEPVVKQLNKLGIKVITGSSAETFDRDQKILIAIDSEGKKLSIKSDKVLVAVGRRPRTEGFGLEQLDLVMNGSYIAIDSRCATSMHNVWAIGDITGNPMLAHRAMAQGHLVAEVIAGLPQKFDKVAIPAVCFTDPEIVSVGLMPDEAVSAGHKIKTGKCSFRANGRSMTLGHDSGFIRIVANAHNHQILGIQACGYGVSELSAGFCLALEMACRLEDISATVHAHPTMSEVLQEAALQALGKAVHV